MTKKEIIDMVATRTGQKHSHTKAVVEKVLEVFIQKLASAGRIEIRNFGVFRVKNTPARIGRNPKTREVAPVPARNIIQFKAGKMMKEKVNADLKKN